MSNKFHKILKLLYILPGFIYFLKEKKVIFLIDGGLGSQMWQYAIGKSIEQSCGMNVYFNMEFYEKSGKDLTGNNNRNWELDKIFPNIKINKANKYEIIFYKVFLNQKFDRKNVITKYHSEVLTMAKPRYLGQYYDNFKYFNQTGDFLHYLYSFDNKSFSTETIEFSNIIKNTICPIAIHIRRGDFLVIGGDKVTPSQYFYNSIEKMKSIINNKNNSELTFFIFSNDIAYCKELFNKRCEKFIFVDINTNDSGAQDMYLMSLCHHFILSASSFGWWAAFLSNNSEKTVIVPQKWRADELPEDQGRMYLDNWICEYN
ncbi:MAG: alpha-1,2-fucosyltransferase [Treponema sp.]|nr:alpha-1,2-fucosyltransferase [Treponema sp.]